MNDNHEERDLGFFKAVCVRPIQVAFAILCQPSHPTISTLATDDLDANTTWDTSIILQVSRTQDASTTWDPNITLEVSNT